MDPSESGEIQQPIQEKKVARKRKSVASSANSNGTPSGKPAFQPRIEPDNPNVDILKIIQSVANEAANEPAAPPKRGRPRKKKEPVEAQTPAPKSLYTLENPPKTWKPRNAKRKHVKDVEEEEQTAVVSEDVPQTTEIPEAQEDVQRDAVPEDVPVTELVENLQLADEVPSANPPPETAVVEVETVPTVPKLVTVVPIKEKKGKNPRITKDDFIKGLERMAGPVPEDMVLGDALLIMREKATHRGFSEELGQQAQGEIGGGNSGEESDDSLEYPPRDSVRRMTGQKPFSSAMEMPNKGRTTKRKRNSDDEYDDDDEDYSPGMELESEKGKKDGDSVTKPSPNKPRKGPIAKGSRRAAQKGKGKPRRPQRRGVDPSDGVDYNPDAPPLTGMSDIPEVIARQCSICFIVFRTRDKLKRHEMAHTTNYEAHCSFCGTHIKYKYNLKNHMKKCGARLRRVNEETNLAEKHQDFLILCAAAAADPTMELPDPSFPYDVDYNGYVYGFDDDITVNLKELIPHYDSAYDGVIDMDDLVATEDLDLEDARFGEEDVPKMPKYTGRKKKVSHEYY